MPTTTTKNLYQPAKPPKVGAGAEAPAPPSPSPTQAKTATTQPEPRPHPKLVELSAAILSLGPNVGTSITVESYPDPITPSVPRVRLYSKGKVFYAGGILDAIEVIKAKAFLNEVPTPNESYTDAEQKQLSKIFADMLLPVTQDGGKKRNTGVIPDPWWRDPRHLWKAFNHIKRYFKGETADKDSGAHPLVHVAWRMLCIAYQETQGRVNPSYLAERNGLLKHPIK